MYEDAKIDYLPAIISDCCFSGAWANEARKIKDINLWQYVYTASTEDESAWDSQDGTGVQIKEIVNKYIAYLGGEFTKWICGITDERPRSIM